MSPEQRRRGRRSPPPLVLTDDGLLQDEPRSWTSSVSLLSGIHRLAPVPVGAAALVAAFGAAPRPARRRRRTSTCNTPFLSIRMHVAKRDANEETEEGRVIIKTKPTRMPH